MTTKHLATAIMASLLAAATATAQSGADLLQKGIYSQETLGDLDGAIQIYRQVTSTPAIPKQIAAQAQYQLVLCMLQKGDRAAATHELDLLTRDFPDQQDFINRARKLIPGASTLLAPPWADGEASQLNIKRNGEFTGEYLFYSAIPYRNSVDDYNRDPTHNRRVADYAMAVYLANRLVTKASTRAVSSLVDRDSLRRVEQERTSFESNDDLGDASAEPFAGPAIDAEPLVFRMRVLPLAVGYKTTLTTLPYVLGHGTPRNVELAVTGVEAVQTLAGKFNCYKVAFASLGQTFWIGVDGARPLVKFQSGNVEAELVKVWGPNAFDDALGFLNKPGWKITNIVNSSAEEGSASAAGPVNVRIWMRRIHSTDTEIARALRNDCQERIPEILRQYNSIKSSTVRDGSVQTHTFGGYPAVSCIVDNEFDNKNRTSEFYTWVHAPNMVLRFTPPNFDIPYFRWVFEPLLDAIKLP